MKIHSAYLEIICSHIEYLFRKISFVYEKTPPTTRQGEVGNNDIRLY